MSCCYFLLLISLSVLISCSSTRHGGQVHRPWSQVSLSPGGAGGKHFPHHPHTPHHKRAPHKRGEHGQQDVRTVTDCMTVSIDEEATWRYDSTGQEETCGIYLVTKADHVVEVTFEEVNVDCEEGLVLFFDGWELNGNVVPSERDHPLPMSERSTDLCSERSSKKVFRSRQNAALISYNIPKMGEGFLIKVKFIPNSDPCNILMADLDGVFTLANNGQARNCSLTTMLFPANFELLHMEIGQSLKKKKFMFGGEMKKRGFSGEMGRKCSGMGASDFVELGGSTDLDTTDLMTKETLCGFHDHPARKGLTVLCGSSTVRLVSSGKYDNTLSLFVKAAGEEDLDFESNLVITCPDF